MTHTASLNEDGVQDTTQLFVNHVKLRWDNHFTTIAVVASSGKEIEEFEITKKDLKEDEDIGLYACKQLQAKGWRGPTLVIWR